MSDKFIRTQYAFDKWHPTIEYRTLERKKVGTWFFGLLPVYKYFYSEWKEPASGAGSVPHP
jgi:hypothetical protein